MEGSIRTREDVFVSELQQPQNNQKSVRCYDCEVYEYWSTPAFIRKDVDRKPTCSGCGKIKVIRDERVCS